MTVWYDGKFKVFSPYGVFHAFQQTKIKHVNLVNPVRKTS